MNTKLHPMATDGWQIRSPSVVHVAGVRRTGGLGATDPDGAVEDADTWTAKESLDTWTEAKLVLSLTRNMPDDPKRTVMAALDISAGPAAARGAAPAARASTAAGRGSGGAWVGILVGWEEVDLASGGAWAGI